MNNIDEWRDKLVGKTLLNGDAPELFNADEVFREKDLPPNHRVLFPDSIMTRDFQPDRLNVFVDVKRKVERVSYC
ncbi:hypothetical protein BD408DRAFT_436914 [Parasitella parasitica]|nr:hypothetical protein BD408DRAFT_436914 [Parasitella parasitica]